MNVGELINNKLRNTLNELMADRDDLLVRTAELSNELLETLKTTGNCINCIDNTEKCNPDKFHKSINKIK